MKTLTSWQPLYTIETRMESQWAAPLLIVKLCEDYPHEYTNTKVHSSPWWLQNMLTVSYECRPNLKMTPCSLRRGEQSPELLKAKKQSSECVCTQAWVGWSSFTFPDSGSGVLGCVMGHGYLQFINVTFGSFWTTVIRLKLSRDAGRSSTPRLPTGVVLS